MARRAICAAVLLLLLALVIGVVSINSELTAAAAVAGARGTVSGRRIGLSPASGGVVEAELLNDGRRIFLAPQAKEVLVVEGRQVDALSPNCYYDRGQFYAVNGAEVKRVWVFAVVSDEKPDVRIAAGD